LSPKPQQKQSYPKYLWLVITALIIAGAFYGIYKLNWVKAPDEDVSVPSTLAELMTYEVVQAYPHDAGSFTQGLIFEDGIFYESAGLYGESSLRKVALETGEVLQQVDLAGMYFAEGLTDWDDTLIQITWQEHVGFVYDKGSFAQVGTFEVATEGWGLTQDGERLIMSDGTATLFFLDPETFAVLDTVTVTDQGQEIVNLNELEWVDGEVFANIWQTDDIVRIDPETGEVVGWIDLSGLLPPEERSPETNVLNGIAYDPEANRLFVTGKLWPRLYEIRLVPVEED
jgi:glutamine cyclotransferase